MIRRRGADISKHDMAAEYAAAAKIAEFLNEPEHDDYNIERKKDHQTKRNRQVVASRIIAKHGSQFGVEYTQNQHGPDAQRIVMTETKMRPLTSPLWRPPTPGLAT